MSKAGKRIQEGGFAMYGQGNEKMEKKQKQKLRKGNRIYPRKSYRKINETYMSPGDGKGWFDSEFWGKATDKTFRK